MKSLLTVDHIQRATADEALDMAWMKQEVRIMGVRGEGIMLLTPFVSKSHGIWKNEG